MPFRCVIVTPEQQVLDESLTQAVLPAHDGLVGILTDRARCWSSWARGHCGWTWPAVRRGTFTSRVASPR
jgi:F0F1-type ATP synthase epsilon subunit